MRYLNGLSVAAIAITISGCSGLETQPDDLPEEPSSAATQLGVAELSNSQGEPAGTVILNQEGESLILVVAIRDLERGERAFHLHTTGRCDAPDFKSAGGHLNPFDKSHGSLSEGGSHLGDLPNIAIDADGTYAGSFALDGKAAELAPFIFDEDGTAVMLHAGPDDYRTDPAGNAGPRIACGVLVRS